MFGRIKAEIKDFLEECQWAHDFSKQREQFFKDVKKHNERIKMSEEQEIRNAVHERLSDELYWGREITTDQIINITIQQVKKVQVRK